MSGTDNQQKSMGVYEGYQVFQNDVDPVVKLEPDDPECDVKQTQTELEDRNNCSVRALLKKMVENRNQEPTVKVVIENLLQQNKILLGQNDTQSPKPNPRIHRKTRSKVPADSENAGRIITPKDPTAGCSMEDIPAINDALVEVTVKEANESNCDPDVVCAVGSKVMLMTPEGLPLNIDITYYWCNFCCFKTEKKSTLLQHIMEHRFHCKYCKFQSFSRAAVIHHCTEEHENFKETTSTLRYCTYLPDMLHKNGIKKDNKMEEVMVLVQREND